MSILFFATLHCPRQSQSQKSYITPTIHIHPNLIKVVDLIWINSAYEIVYSVSGFLEAVWLLETLIRKLLQFLLNPVMIFLGVYTSVSKILTKNIVNQKVSVL